MRYNQGNKPGYQKRCPVFFDCEMTCFIPIGDSDSIRNLRQPDYRKSAISYQLLIEVSRGCKVRIGKLGKFYFPPGLYVYTGSARNNPTARIRRHLSKKKKLRWHIDYLLGSSYAKVLGMRISAVTECKLNQTTSGSIVVGKFGATDCRNKCRSHLKYLGKNSRIKFLR